MARISDSRDLSVADAADVRAQLEGTERRASIEASIDHARQLSVLVPPGDDTTALIRCDRDAGYGGNLDQ